MSELSSNYSYTVNDLPVEVSATIFRYLDANSLVNIACVNKSWKKVCRGDPILRRRIGEELTRRRMAKRKHMRQKLRIIGCTRTRLLFYDISMKRIYDSDS